MVLVFILSQEASKQLALLVVVGEHSCISLQSQQEQHKIWQWPVSEAIVILCVHFYKQLMVELSQKVTRSVPKGCSLQGVYTREKDLCKNLGVKEGGGVCSKGANFCELTVILELR